MTPNLAALFQLIETKVTPVQTPSPGSKARAEGWQEALAEAEQTVAPLPEVPTETEEGAGLAEQVLENLPAPEVEPAEVEIVVEPAEVELVAESAIVPDPEIVAEPEIVAVPGVSAEAEVVARPEVAVEPEIVAAPPVVLEPPKPASDVVIEDEPVSPRFTAPSTPDVTEATGEFVEAKPVTRPVAPPVAPVPEAAPAPEPVVITVEDPEAVPEVLPERASPVLKTTAPTADIRPEAVIRSMPEAPVETPVETPARPMDLVEPQIEEIPAPEPKPVPEESAPREDVRPGPEAERVAPVARPVIREETPVAPADRPDPTRPVERGVQERAPEVPRVQPEEAAVSRPDAPSARNDAPPAVEDLPREWPRQEEVMKRTTDSSIPREAEPARQAAPDRVQEPARATPLVAPREVPRRPVRQVAETPDRPRVASSLSAMHRQATETVNRVARSFAPAQPTAPAAEAPIRSQPVQAAQAVQAEAQAQPESAEVIPRQPAAPVTETPMPEDGTLKMPAPPAVSTDAGTVTPVVVAGTTRLSAGTEAARPGGALPIHYTDLAEALVARARALPRNGAVQLRFSLEPRDLGLVRVNIETRGEQVTVRIAATSVGALDALNSGVVRLEGQLQEAGYSEPEIQLTLDTPNEQGARHAAHQRGEGQETAGRRGAGNSRHRGHAQREVHVPAFNPPREGSLDRVA